MFQSFLLTKLTTTAFLVGSLLSSAQAQEPTMAAAPTQTTPLVPIPNEGLSAMAWVQSSVEAKVAAKQAYYLAARQLDIALRDKKWSAAIEQSAGFGKLPPAIILDLDETVLDNSFYMARLIRDNTQYTDESWAQWTAQADAPALQGAIKFLNYAASKGVNIFYISNRPSDEEAATRENLRRLGCPLQGPEDHILLVGEKPDWPSDKTSRRRLIAQKYRVLLLVGDDLNDFVSARSLTLEQRLALYNKYNDYWGERWIVLSNPTYGSWEDALYGFNYDLPRAEMLRRKYDVLQYREPLPATTLPAVPTAPILPPIPPASP